jgi:hypothetical protein
MSKSIVYRLSVLVIISATVMGLTGIWLYLWPPPSLIISIERQRTPGEGFIPLTTLAISFFTFVVTAMGSASTIILNWRSERRQVAQLEIQKAEAKTRQPPYQNSN